MFQNTHHKALSAHSKSTGQQSKRRKKEEKSEEKDLPASSGVGLGWVCVGHSSLDLRPPPTTPPVGSGWNFFFSPRLHLRWEISKDGVKETAHVRRERGNGKSKRNKTNPSLVQNYPTASIGPESVRKLTNLA